MRSAIARGVGIALVVVLVLSVKVVMASRAELSEADRAFDRGALEEAVTHYRRAARWYLPIQPYADAAIDRLLDIGVEAEERGDRTLALASFRSAHAAILSARTVFVPDAERLARADDHIAHLMASAEVPAVDAGLSSEARAELYRSMLDEDRDPILGWSLLALLGLCAWVFGAYQIFMRALDQDDRFIDAELKKWGTLFVLGMGLFLLGLRFA